MAGQVGAAWCLGVAGRRGLASSLLALLASSLRLDQLQQGEEGCGALVRSGARGRHAAALHVQSRQRIGAAVRQCN